MDDLILTSVITLNTICHTILDIVYDTFGFLYAYSEFCVDNHMV